MLDFPRPPFPNQPQPRPGKTAAMKPAPDHGETSYKGSGRLNGKKAVITGGDSGIGRAVAIAYAREGADILISYLNEHDDARETGRLVTNPAGRPFCARRHTGPRSMPRSHREGGIRAGRNRYPRQQCSPSGQLQVNRGHQRRRMGADVQGEHSRDVLSYQGSDKPHEAGYLHDNTASVNSDVPNPTLLAYATTKGAIHNFTAGLAQMLAEKGIRANAVAPEPIWTPLIPSTLPDDSVKNFGMQVPMKRPGQPVELATAYVMLADPLSSYVSGATIAVTGGKPFL